MIRSSIEKAVRYPVKQGYETAFLSVVDICLLFQHWSESFAIDPMSVIVGMVDVVQ